MKSSGAHKNDANLEKRQAISSRQHRWPNKRIPFKFAPNTFSQKDIDEIQLAIKEWREKTCLKIEPAEDYDKNFVLFQNGPVCSSFVGMRGGMQPIILGGACRKKRTVLHEFGHAVGFYHQHNRPDRDDYVEIVWTNVVKGNEFAFDKLTLDSNAMYFPYDYESIMHYGGWSHSANGRATMLTKVKEYQNTIGTSLSLSTYDILAANLMYGCFSHI